MNHPLNPEMFYIAGFSPEHRGPCLEEAMKILRQYALVAENSCCKNAQSLALMTIFSHLSEHWINMSAEEIYAEISRFSTLIQDNQVALSEYHDLVDIMTRYAAPGLEKEAGFWAHKIAVGCCGKDHLYSDMGYTDRKEVSKIMQKYFPSLADLNPNSKMKWKKFLYKQICLEANIPVCPTPSCQECSDYNKCFTTDD